VLTLACSREMQELESRPATSTNRPTPPLYQLNQVRSPPPPRALIERNSELGGDPSPRGTQWKQRIDIFDRLRTASHLKLTEARPGQAPVSLFFAGLLKQYEGLVASAARPRTVHDKWGSSLEEVPLVALTSR